ncbi:MAG: diaminopimelate dehydrogenase [Alphaproteobacteria bacterium]|nr:diaminopimelate dehydrogenase [Alphaproteobacteria bacterium]
MKKINIVISGWGNIGRAAARVYQMEKENNPENDIELVGIIRRNVVADDGYPAGVPVVTDIRELTAPVHVVLCCGPNHALKNDVVKFLEMGIATVDTFDSHKEINEYREIYNKIAIANKTVSILGSGWDPGLFSIVRALFAQLSPRYETFTNFGPGRSMGHTTIVKEQSPYIRNAVSITKYGATPGAHKREVYVEVMPGSPLDNADEQEKLRDKILAHPYFKNDDSHIYFVESIAEYDTSKHGGRLLNESADSKIELTLNGDNPMMTANMMHASARAAHRAVLAGQFGCFTTVERPPLDFIPGETVAERLNRIKY